MWIDNLEDCLNVCFNQCHKLWLSRERGLGEGTEGQNDEEALRTQPRMAS